LVVIALGVLLAVEARAAPKTRPSLAETVAKRLRAALGVPVSLGGIRFSLFDGTLSLDRLRVGPRRAPLLTLKRAEAQPALSSSGNHQRLKRLTLRGFRIRVPLRQLGAPLPRARGVSSVAVDALSASGGVISIGSKAGGVVLSGVSVTGGGLRVAFGKGGPRPKGRLSLRAKTMKLGTLTLRDLQVEIDAKARVLSIRGVTARLKGGTLVAKGSIALRRGRFGRLRLKGSYSGRGVKASFSMAGKVGGTLKLRGRVRGTGKGRLPLLPSAGGVARSPRLRLDLRWGKQRVWGRLDRWRTR
jgi:hypothetical protein